MNQELVANVDEYIIDLLAQEDDALQHALKTTEEAGIIMMQISPTQGKLLQTFAKMCNAKMILELGTLGGYSTIWLARSIPEDGKVITLEIDALCTDVARKNFEYAGLADKIEIRLGKAMDILPQLQNDAPFDLVFIDADKPPYTEYFEWAIKLCRPGSIIIADNVIRDGKVLDANSTDDKVQGVRRFNQAIADNKKVTGVILQTVGIKEYDGMAVCVVN